MDKYYISGPMTGLPDFNYPEFQRVEDTLTRRGLTIVSPHHNGKMYTPEEHKNLSWDFFQRLALKNLLECTCVVLLPGWENSRGARREFDIALDLKMKVFILNADGSLTLITGKLK